ncbi:MAG: Gfo/Idh/MocA family protein [Phycisphaerae bacterium]
MIRNPELKDRVRYAVVGLGWIAQEDVLPAFTLKERNYELAALVSGDAEKRAELGRKYGINKVVGYEQYEELLAGADIDAVFIALPNRMHAEYAIKAAKADVHVLCEKPMALNEHQCREMIEAADHSGVKLMIAYRLHFEEANMTAVEIVNSGYIGEPRLFTSTFCQQVKAGNIRLDHREGYGPVMDMGVYPINAARYLFRSEPTAVSALSEAIAGDDRWREVPEMTSVTLRFPKERLAQFTVSFNGGGEDVYHVVGTKGTLTLKPAFAYESETELVVTVQGKEERRKFKKTQQFGAEIEYFSRCILEDKDPEPDGLEGLADIRIVNAVEESAKAGGKPVSIEPVAKAARPNAKQVIKMPAKQATALVKAESPGG